MSAASETRRDHNDGSTSWSQPPSHILQDGTFVYLPPPSNVQRTRFMERAIAEHGLLQEDLQPQKTKSRAATATATDNTTADATQDNDDASTVGTEKTVSKPQVHPLALASAQLQKGGVDELNRVINLQTLVQTGQYFSLSNVIDPNLELSLPSAATGSSAAVSKPAGATTTTNAQDEENEARVRASYCLKRKRQQFQSAQAALSRHRRRLLAAVVSQHRPDQQLQHWRSSWRLVAPEHGTRAIPHAPRPTEIIAADVDVYDTTASRGAGNEMSGQQQLGKLAARIPRFAVLELDAKYDVKSDVEDFLRTFADSTHKVPQGPTGDAMDVEDDGATGPESAENNESENISLRHLKAVPFAIPDPRLGRVDAEFDPAIVAMLSLQFSIEKDSTSSVQSARLDTMSATNESDDDNQAVLERLQHSLLCAKIFESIRREIAPDTEEVGQVKTSAKAQSVVWLSNSTEQNFWPAPHLMVPGEPDAKGLCVVHCHEGEIKVMLDCEYALRVKLVDAHGELDNLNGRSDTHTDERGSMHTADELMVTCRTLLMHAQQTYHDYCLQVMADEQRRQVQLATATEAAVHERRSEATRRPSHVLQRCVRLGSKLLFESRIRQVIIESKVWMRNSLPDVTEPLRITWLRSSALDDCSHFVLSQGEHQADASITAESITITSFALGTYRKATFHSVEAFSLCLRGTLRRWARWNHNNA